MKTEKKFNVYVNLFNSILFAVIFTMVGGFITSGVVDWHNFLVEALFSAVVGFIISTVIPIGKWDAALACKVAKTGTFLFNLIMAAVRLLILLLFLCPIMTLFIGYVIHGATVSAMLPNLYSVFIPMFLIAIVVTMLVSGFITKLSMKCAGMSSAAKKEYFDSEPLPSENA